MYKSIISEVSLEEMKTMRQNGMTNRQIADSLGVSYKSVYKYLGKQPDMLRAVPGTYSSAVHGMVEQKPVSTTLSKKSGLKLVMQTSVVAGEFNQYTINNFGNVEIRRNSENANLRLDFDGMEKYITELMEVYSMMSKGKMGGDA